MSSEIKHKHLDVADFIRTDMPNMIGGMVHTHFNDIEGNFQIIHWHNNQSRNSILNKDDEYLFLNSYVILSETINELITELRFANARIEELEEARDE
jgi:hypothetical protein